MVRVQKSTVPLRSYPEPATPMTDSTAHRPGPTHCPHCGHDNVYDMRENRVYAINEGVRAPPAFLCARRCGWVRWDPRGYFIQLDGASEEAQAHMREAIAQAERRGR